jgi:hypothetical protein
MEQDYPAAHSMDTAWYAVDRDGHVAFFWSGEAGAVPAGAADEETNLDLVRASRPGGEVVYDLRGLVLPGREAPGGDHVRLTGDGGREVFLFLDSAGAVREELAAGAARLFPATSGVGVYFERLAGEVAARLHEAGHCLGCFHSYDVGLFSLESEHDPATMGLFVYDHLCENWTSGPYGRARFPRSPLHVDQLPPAVREQVLQVRFPTLCFQDTTHIQPVEHMECASWEQDYLTVDGKERRSMETHEPVEDDEE